MSWFLSNNERTGTPLCHVWLRTCYFHPQYHSSPEEGWVGLPCLPTNIYQTPGAHTATKRLKQNVAWLHPVLAASHYLHLFHYWLLLYHIKKEESSISVWFCILSSCSFCLFFLMDTRSSPGNTYPWLMKNRQKLFVKFKNKPWRQIGTIALTFMNSTFCQCRLKP